MTSESSWLSVASHWCSRLWPLCCGSESGFLSDDDNGRSKWWRKFNGVRVLLWFVMAPVAFVMGWVNSVRFVSFISLYANWASDMAAWRADVNPSQEQLDRIEAKLDKLLREGGIGIDN